MPRRICTQGTIQQWLYITTTNFNKNTSSHYKTTQDKFSVQKCMQTVGNQDGMSEKDTNNMLNLMGM